MMYLSRLMMNPRDRLARADLSNPYELHRTIMSGFKHTGPLTGERVLFRLEPSDPLNPAGNMVLVQSLTLPDWAELAARGKYLINEPQVRSFETFQIKTGDILRFRLRANPARRETLDHRRRAITALDERRTWLERKAAASGFNLFTVSLNIRDTHIRPFWAPQKAPAAPAGQPKHLLAVHMVDFDGFLEVTDPAALLLAVQNGIGAGKGFGCGLLSLARA